MDRQTPLALEFSRQEYWSGLQFNLKANSTNNYRYHDRVSPKQMVLGSLEPTFTLNLQGPPAPAAVSLRAAGADGQASLRP